MTVTQTTDEIYPSHWIKAEDIPDDGDLIVTISDVNVEQVGMEKESKLICVFRETAKKLALNVTNAKVLTDLFSKDPNQWIGKRIALYATEVEYGGKTTLGVRIRKRPPAKPQPQQQEPQPSEPQPQQQRRNPDEIIEELGY